MLAKAKEGGVHAMALTMDFAWYGNRERFHPPKYSLAKIAEAIKIRTVVDITMDGRVQPGPDIYNALVLGAAAVGVGEHVVCCHEVPLVSNLCFSCFLLTTFRLRHGPRTISPTQANLTSKD